MPITVQNSSLGLVEQFGFTSHNGKLSDESPAHQQKVFERWKRDHTREARRDAVQRSQAVTLGKVYEHLIPYMPDFRWNPKDARFVGTPVDFLVFDGLSEGQVKAVVFVEVKTGSSTMNPRERQVRDAIVNRRVEWQQLAMPDVRVRPEPAA